MNEVLLDTDVFSFIFKDDGRAQAYKVHLDRCNTFLSFMTVSELYRWAVSRSWGDARIRLLRQRIAACTILDPNDAVRWTWAKLMSAKGRPMSATDAWIAAAAVTFDLPLVTHNRADFEGIPDLRGIDAHAGLALVRIMASAEWMPSSAALMMPPA